MSDEQVRSNPVVESRSEQEDAAMDLEVHNRNELESEEAVEEASFPRSAFESDPSSSVMELLRQPSLTQTSSSTPVRRMNAARRQRILLGILFHRMMARRDGRLAVSLAGARNAYWLPDSSEEEQDMEADDEDASIGSASNTSLTTSRPALRCLTQAQAQKCNVACRFCLDIAMDVPGSVEGASDTEIAATKAVSAGGQNTTEAIASMLIAPCHCTGSSEYVHVECLRKWQLQTTKASHAVICSVCTTRYALRPPKLRQDLVPAGSLLVFQDPHVLQRHQENDDEEENEEDENLTSQSIFAKSVILMLEGGDAETPIGVVLNKPLLGRSSNDSSNDSGMDTDADSDSTVGESSDSSTEITDTAKSNEEPNLSLKAPQEQIVYRRRGGPVCGGRFGVTRHVVLEIHENQGSATMQETKDDDSMEGDNLDEGIWNPFQKDLYSQHRVSQDMYSVYDKHTKEPAMLGRSKLAKLEQAVASHPSSNPNSKPPSSIVAFEGCCKWSKDQLKAEIMRGSWAICHVPDETLKDLVTKVTLDSGFKLWHRLMDQQKTTATRDFSWLPPLLPKEDWFRFSPRDEAQLFQAHNKSLQEEPTLSTAKV